MLRSRTRTAMQATLMSAALATPCALGQALTPTFTYQGALEIGGAPTSSAHSFQFRLCSSGACGAADVLQTIPASPVSLTPDDGLFTYPVSFSSNHFAGNRRWVEVVVDGTPLCPRQEITATPYSLFSLDTQKIATRSVSTAAPAVNDVLKWNGAQWVPAAGGGFSLPFYSAISLNGTAFSVENTSTTADDIAIEGVISSSTPGANSIGVAGINRGTGGNGIGVYGVQSGSGWGVKGESLSGFGVYGYSVGTATAVRGHSALGIGLWGSSNSQDAVQGRATAAGFSGVAGFSTNGNGYGVYASNPNGVALFATSPAHDALQAVCSAPNRSAVAAFNDNGAGFGVYGENSANGGIAIVGQNLATGGASVGTKGVVFSTASGTDTSGPTGVLGVVMPTAAGSFSAGVRGINNSTDGFGIGVIGYHAGSGWGVYGKAANSTNGYAGYFSGRVHVTGNLSKGGGSFKIDHPLDPANKYLYHSFVESPDMKNIYDGVITLDASGRATVEMPDWFDALNRDFRYQLTAVGAAAPNMHVSHELADRRFVIAGGSAGMKVSWQVTGIRQDAFANANRIPIEQEKAAEERGRFLHPTAFGQPESLSVIGARTAADEPLSALGPTPMAPRPAIIDQRPAEADEAALQVPAIP